jgi:hypothetical protein
VREDGGVAELGGRFGCEAGESGRVGDGYWRGKGADQVA